jgi:deazaflavin-dependent oxidoreductase (nitroreductase family)
MSELKLPDAWMQTHIDDYLRTDGAVGHVMDFSAFGGAAKTTNLLLTTIGRKSGKAFALPLIYIPDGDRFVVVGSKGGADEHPAWYLNLQAQPEVKVQVLARRFSARAYTASGEDRQRLWKLVCDMNPLYPLYQSKTTRELPVVVLEPKE